MAQAIRRIGVLGAGTMGHGIAESFAMYGYDVNLYDINPDVLAKSKSLIEQELQMLAAENLIAAEEIPAMLGRITLFSDLKAAVEDRDYVVESAPEDMALKQNLFRQLDALCPPHTVLASNTSSLALGEMMTLVSEQRRQRMIVTHLFNPAHLIPLVEVSAFGNMPEDVLKTVEELYAAIGKQPIRVLKDVPGLVANRIMQAVAREVFSLIEQGVAAPCDVDRALKFGPAFRYATTGQLEVADFGGLDIWCSVGDNLLPVMDSSQRANALLREKVAAGKLGVKSGEGFYKYDPATVVEVKQQFMTRLIRQLRVSRTFL